MGDYGLGLSSNVRSLSPVDFNQLSNHPSLFSPEILNHHQAVKQLETSTMQDETLAALKSSKQLSPQPQQLSPSSLDIRTNGESPRHDGYISPGNVSVAEVPNHSTILDGSFDDGSIHANVPSPVSLGLSSQLDSATSALNTAPVANLWSMPVSADDTYIQGFPTMSSLNGGLTGGLNNGINGHNGHGPSVMGSTSMPFQSFPPQPVPNQLYNNQTLSQQFSSMQIGGNQQSPAQRRAITGQQQLPPALQQQQQQQRLAAANLAANQSNPFYNNSKTYPTWSSAAQQQQTPWSNGQTQNPNPINPWSNVQRRQTSVPNANPIGAQFQFQKKMINSSIISPSSRYRRSTSYPGQVQHHPAFGKTPFDLLPTDEHREMYNVFGGYQQQQQTQSQDRMPFDTMRFPMLENHLMDIMRGANNQGQDHQDQVKMNQRFPFLMTGKSPFGNLVEDGHFLDDNNLDQTVPNMSSPNRGSPSGLERIERFSRKVFVGGLPPDIDEEEITAAFRRFGALVVDWPHKAESKSYFPPKGYCFLLFQDELSVQNLINSCILDDEKLYWCVSSPTMKDKPVQIRPWNLSDSDFVMDGSQPLDPRKTIFVGGVPRPLRAIELAMIMDRLYGGVCYAGIDTDPELKYPKGAGRVAFSNQQSYIAAISARFVQLQHGDIDKRVEVKPYVLDDQMCDECAGTRCAGKFAPFFCANVMCLQYYCEQCWAQVHSRQGREFHKPLVKEGADRPRAVPFRWC